MRRLLAVLDDAAADGLDPDRYDTGQLKRLLGSARNGRPEAIAAADIALSNSLADYVRDLHRPAPEAAIAYVGPGLAPPPYGERQVLEAAAAAPSLSAYLASLHHLNPIYDALVSGLARYRASWGALPRQPVDPWHGLHPGSTGPAVAALRKRLGLATTPAVFDEPLQVRLRSFQHVHGLDESGVADHATLRALNIDPKIFERRILLNIDRARALPARLGERFVLVDVPRQRLLLFDHGHVDATIRVIVGKPSEQTPVMAGRIQYAMLNPYWNIPPDLMAERARRVLRDGPGVLAREHIQLLSGWGAGAHVLRPSQVDWNAVASGAVKLRARQLPGPDNMMGTIKFMLPNRFGVYLHDTANHALFERPVRLLSAGCVRVQSPQLLGRWLFDGPVPAADGTPEQKAPLPHPVPVYITYFTAFPSAQGVIFEPDVYKRDPKLLTALALGPDASRSS